MKTYIVDTYAWIALTEGNKKFKQEIEESLLETPIIVLCELSKVLEKKKIEQKEKDKILDYVINNSLLIPFSQADAINSGRISAKENLYLVDGIVYSYTSKEKPLLTGDKHFKGKPFVCLIEG